MDSYIRNNADLVRMLKPKMYEWILEKKQNLPKYLKDFMISEYYNQYSPVLYDRKYRILSAVMSSNIKDIGNGYELEIYLDPNKVSYDPSFWVTHGVTNYIKGDSPDVVFHNMANGIHGDISFGVTDGRFWETFLNEIGEGGTYDMFLDFKKYMGAKR